MTSEKRRFARYVFSNDDKITALLSLNNDNGSIEARVLNISQGGLGLAINKTERDLLKEDAVLLLKKVTGEKRMTFFSGLSIKVKWILDYHPLNNLAIGCEFIALNNECRREIDSLLDKTD